jgi:hypothetical protein
MRPVLRGPCPTGDDGQDVVYSDYAQARGELIKRMGERCSYCEMHLDASLAVEHVKPKKPPGAAHAIPERELAWDNFLLACPNCNSTKGDTDVVLADYVWPDNDNTFAAFVYAEGGLVAPAKGPHEARALAMIKLVGLHKTPNTAEASDRRWQNRLEAWAIAQESLKDLVEHDTPALRRQIIRTVSAGAYWSVWMTVFKDRPAMLREMIKALPGTSEACFNEVDGYAPVARPVGQ